MTVVGTVLTEVDDHEPMPTVFLHRVNGTGVELLRLSSAQALLTQVTASLLAPVTGDLTRGFAWPVHGAVPRHSQAVIPLATPMWPESHDSTVVFIELWWRPDDAGYRRVRSFLGYVADPFDAYLVACCLWSTRSTGGGAQAAFLYGPDRQTVFRINAMAKTCAQLPSDVVVRFAATASDRDTTDPLPDQLPGRSAAVSDVRQERRDGKLAYVSTDINKIIEVMLEHADAREASFDPVEARALRLAADEFKNGTRTEYLHRACYIVEPAGLDGGDQ